MFNPKRILSITFHPFSGCFLLKVNMCLRHDHINKAKTGIIFYVLFDLQNFFPFLKFLLLPPLLPLSPLPSCHFFLVFFFFPSSLLCSVVKIPTSSTFPMGCSSWHFRPTIKNVILNQSSRGKP